MRNKYLPCSVVLQGGREGGREREVHRLQRASLGKAAPTCFIFFLQPQGLAETTLSPCCRLCELRQQRQVHFMDFG